MTKKYTGMIAMSIAVSAILVGCGGSGNDSSESVAGGANGGAGSGSSGGTAGGTAGTCEGTSRAATMYDVFLPTANGITQNGSSRNVQLYGQTTDNKQCIGVAGSTAQLDSSPGTIQIATTDNWNNAITYVDSSAPAVSGGIKFNQGLFVTCKNGSDAFLHVGIANPGGNATSFVSTNQLATVVKNTALQGYECIQTGPNTVPGVNSSLSMTFSATDGSVTVMDAGEPTVISAADLPSLFTQTGYNLKGIKLNWYLYQLPTGAGTKQVIVNTAKKPDGTYSIDLYVAQ